MVKISSQEAYYILKNLDTFVSSFENSTEQKMTPGAVQILHEILLDAAFPSETSRDALH